MPFRFPTAWARALRLRYLSQDPTCHLTQPLVLEDGRSPRILSAMVYTISGFVIAAIVWAAITDVREITIASGQIVPRGQIHTVHHLEGGIIAELLVNEGARVVEGQPLVRLDPVVAASDFEQLQARRATLRLQIIRLDAEAHGTSLEFGELGLSFPNLAAEQAKLYASNKDQRKQERLTLAARLAQKQHEVASILAALETSHAQLEVQREQFAIQSELLDKGLTARKTHLDSRAALLRVEGDVMVNQTKLATAHDSKTEAESALAQSDAAASQKIAAERAKAAGELAETEQQIAKFADRFGRLVVRSPSTGVVQEIVPKAAGEVLKPGEIIGRIVPSNFELVAEVRIDPRHSGHVQPGAPARVKFATYDSAVFGTLHGIVEQISPTTFAPQVGQQSFSGQAAPEPYYKAIVRLESEYLGAGANRRPISAGMKVDANIITGAKSMARYLLKPIFNSLEVAFTER